ncbi:MAG: prepilin-type N-terminal cleavage/methylation domain-containing protein [Xanthomonadales bacterium]|jgi:prepilin-type N-terminal cleavage/methylation domain-containing protein|nr:prepilin-type N-terminal cleavage/methylation domain-containing protein [Xanthomonadales bacterium]
MIGTFRHGAGFTLIELALVLIVFGILAVALVPMIQVVHDDAMRKQDLASLETAKNALLGYIRINEGVPCVDAAGDQVSSGCDPTKTLDLLGVRTTDSRRRTFAYDVNDTLTLAEIAASGNSLCTALANIIDPPFPPATPPAPSVCASTNANTGSTACAAANPMVFVLAGRGSDRCLNLENTHASAGNDAVCPTAVAANRIFENPARIHSRTQDDGYYEDLVLTVTPSELAEAMGCPVGGGSGGFSYCLAGEKLVQVINGVNNAMGVNLSGACFTVDRGTSASLGCLIETTPIEVHTNTSCSSLQFSGTVGSLDTNTDGRTDIVCTATNCTSR